MSATTTTHPFNRTYELSQLWLKELQEELGYQDEQRAYHILWAVLHALRDRLTVDEATDLSAQLPMLIRGLFFEGWKPSATPTRERSLEDFLAAVRNHVRRPDVNPEEAARAVFALLQRRVTEGEIEDVKQMLPAEVRSLWPSEA